MKTFTVEELAKMNGEAGAETYVAVDGKVYDVSSSKRWIKGSHMKRHRAGADLTTDLLSAPHGREVLERMPLIGLLEQSAPIEMTGLRGKVEAFLDRHPFFRRHPHPAVVHIPVGFFTALPLVQLAALKLQSTYTEWTAFLMLLIGWVVIPAAIVTGYFTWWVNYEAKESSIIQKKRLLAWLAFTLGVALIYIRLFHITDPVDTKSTDVLLYSVLMLGIAGMVGLIGFLGGKLTFPYDHH